MANELTIEQLKFAREIGATWRLDSDSPWPEAWLKEINGQCYFFFVDKSDWVRAIKDGHPSEWKDAYKIDFSPLDDYYADKELDIAATGGEVDMVNHPPHYQSDNGIECIDAIRAALGKEGFIAYCRGNAMKYTWRDKQNNAEDYRKAAWYLEKAAQEQGK